MGNSVLTDMTRFITRKSTLIILAQPTGGLRK